MYNSFKHVDVKTANIYISLTSFYIVIKNILRNIDQIKKIDQQKSANANRNINFNKNQINSANNNQNDKKFQKSKKSSMFVNCFQQQSQN